MKKTTIIDAVIVAYGRSPIGRGGKGSFKDTHPVDLGAQVLMGVLNKIPQLNLELIDDVIVGCANPCGVQGKNMARIIAQRAGLPDDVPGQTVNRFCASGLQTIATAANAIIAGQADVIVAGGVESMSKLPMGGGNPDDLNQWIVENRPGVYTPMGITAENVALKYNINRIEMEKMAVESHLKAAKAQEGGLFEKEIIPIIIRDENGNDILIKNDEGIRPNTNIEGLAKLKPSFKKDGIVTAATSSQVSDGAAFVIIMSAEKAAEIGIKPIARFIGYSVAGVPGEIMGTGPTKAVPKLLKRLEMTVDDFDIIELNEAFAAQAIPCINELGFDITKLNPRGGAMALGHPLGATGAILTCKAISYLEDNNGRYALITMCIGGGMGAAGVIEKL